MSTRLLRAALAWPLCAILLAAGLACRATESAPPLRDDEIETVAAELDSLAPALMAAGRIPGLQAVLVRGGEIVWRANLGVANATTGAPVTGETIFEAASLTKPLFAYAVMKLADRGEFDLDAPLASLLPEQAIEAGIGHRLDLEGFHLDWFERITARHILSHSSGMPHGERGTPFPLFFEPGSSWRYSADGYFFLQLAVERTTGRSVVDIVDAEVLAPLGMTRSSMVWRDDYERTMANGHDWSGEPEAFRKRREASAAASLYTTAADYARFVIAVMAGDGLRKETAAEMLSPRIPMNGERGLHWSLGFGIQRDENGDAFWQWGDYGIFRNYAIAYPAEGSALVYLANSWYGLGICVDLVETGLGGHATGVEHLGYRRWNSPQYTFLWTVMEEGAPAVERLLPRLRDERPDIFAPGIISWIASEFLGRGEKEVALAFYRSNAEFQPGSAAALTELGRALLASGDRAEARRLLARASAAPDTEGFDRSLIEWVLPYLDALDRPAALDSGYLASLAGDYGPRHIRFESGRLSYARGSTDPGDFRRMYAVSRDTFVVEGILRCRMRFELGPDGGPTAIVGVYEGGHEDRTARDDAR